MKLLRFFILLCMPVLFFIHCTASPRTQQSSSQEEKHDIQSSVIEEKEAAVVQPVPSEPIEQKKEQPVVTPSVQEKPKVIPPKPVKKEEKSVVQEKTPEKPKEEVTAEQKEAVKKVEEEEHIIAEFEGVKITKETYKQTKSEIELVVDELNRITAKKDYERWLSLLAPSYKQMYSDIATLKAASEALPIKGIRLRTLKDYFLYVFVPSRQNIKVDDIQFLSPTQVNVLMFYGKDALLVYRIENTADGWQLIPSK